MPAGKAFPENPPGFSRGSVKGALCPHCHIRIGSYDDYCEGCGYKITIPRCPNCDSIIPVSRGLCTDWWKENQYCKDCGEKLPSFSEYELAHLKK